MIKFKGGIYNVRRNKNVTTNDNGEELSTEELEYVSGGSLKDVNYSKTTDISKDTKYKI